MNPKLLEIVACPICHGRLQLDESAQQLICRFDQLSYPISNGIPVLLRERAQPLVSQEKTNINPEESSNE